MAQVKKATQSPKLGNSSSFLDRSIFLGLISLDTGILLSNLNKIQGKWGLRKLGS